MLFSVSGVEISPIIPPLVAFSISFFTSMGGVSGAFLLLPFQMSVLGYTTPSVSGTNQVFNIVATPGGVYRYIKEKRMVWPIAAIVVAGTIPGVFGGALIRMVYLPDPTNFMGFAGIVLLLIGLKLLSDLKKKDKQKGITQTTNDLFQVELIEFNSKKIVFTFDGTGYTVNTLLLFLLTFFVGITGGIYGIGGGAIIAPFLVTMFKLPVYAISGAALLGTLITSVAGVIFYYILGFYYPESAITPDLLLGFLFGIGGFSGMYCGARLQKFFPSRIIKIILFVCIAFPAMKYIFSFIKSIIG